jgi:putative oxidoreductase
MSNVGYGPKPLFPALERFYAFAVPFSWLVIRIAVGWNLIVHGWGKLARGVSPAAPAFSQMGFEPGLLWAWASTVLELVGGVCILLGLFTRFFAAAVAIEMLVIFCVYWKTGFSWLNRGYEYVLLWGLVSFAIALRGGGPYSIDSRLPKEL